MEFEAGQLVAGKFRVERVLGRGGMGVVVLAHHLALDEQVAIKFLLPEAFNSGDALARFEREARAAVKIRSEHVARVMDVGRLESGAPYMVMELLRGCDLSQLLQQHGPLQVGDTADFILQACEAIAEAHELGIVHRDLKPQNLFLTARADGSSCVKVLDFGISKMTSTGSSPEQAMTATSVTLGSPLYMSPEQLMSARDVDARTDIWALGVICFELLTGKTPFVADSLPQLCMAISLGQPRSLSAVRPDVPAALDALLRRCLEKDRNRRVASVAELASELVKFAPLHASISADRISRLSRGGGRSAPSGAAASGALTTALPVVPTAVSAPVHTLADHETMGSFGQTEPGSSSKRNVGLVVLGMTAALATGAFWLRARFATPSSAGTSAAASVAVRAQVTAASPPFVAPSVVETSPAPAPPPTAALASPATPAASAAGGPVHTPRAITAVVSSVRSAVRAGAPTAAVSVSPRSTADCDIPYSFDSHGNKIFKKNCL